VGRKNIFKPKIANVSPHQDCDDNDSNICHVKIYF